LIPYSYIVEYSWEEKMESTYKFRVNKLAINDGWVEATGTSFEDALQNWHTENVDLSDAEYEHWHHDPADGDVEHFLIAYNEAGERFISRMVSCPLRRKGGVRSRKPSPTKQELAVSLGLSSAALDGPWEGEEEDWH